MIGVLVFSRISWIFHCIAIAVLIQEAACVVVPSSNCYVFDNNSRLYDFTDWSGHAFQYEGKNSPDVVVRFCKDVESRSQQGYVDFGQFSAANYFVRGTDHVNFVQGFHKGDLLNCESSYDKMGRSAQVNIICGNCTNGVCKGELGCICDVTYDSTMCRAFVELALPCRKTGLRVFEGFTVGFHPRSWEVVYNGLTQLGFEKAQSDFSFGTEQTHISLYMTAVSSFSGLVGKADVKVHPETGLLVELSGTGTNGGKPTTLSPTTLMLNLRCERPRTFPYEVAVTIPVDGYDPVEFVLTKKCDYRQAKDSRSVMGWATFGVLSCILFVLSTAFCCGGFIYKTKVEHQRGLYALPGMTILAACLETLSERGRGYPQAENSPFLNQTSWDHVPATNPTTDSSSRRNYGSTDITSTRNYGSL